MSGGYLLCSGRYGEGILRMSGTPPDGWAEERFEYTKKMSKKIWI